ncbi:hypothetical protein B0H16DRAFT_1295048 [Mycena metata]|uniref:Zinc finger PHD-type domain-containing protein n=1 Tax=Mycena metata TaxID=1033252 RepID=A0AAD7KIZ1_9AGAR|nr:hypothetical protein B0H16DRAFT_1346425 [Mycena metata]KAJ7785930.1 hypothetical protein B0H16DRAFT_1295048 [Mycena metata]
MLLPADEDLFTLPSPLANLSPPPRQTELPLRIEASPPGPVVQNAEAPLSWMAPRGFDFSCRCGDHGPDGLEFARGLEVIHCEKCSTWSHVSCQRFGRAAGLPKSTPFYCDRCVRMELPIPSAPKAGRKRTQRIELKVGMGALAKYGKYHYPVRLLLRLPRRQGWRVRFWRGCAYPPDVPPPDPEKAVTEDDLVDSLYGNQAARRRIRLGKYMHAHEIPVEEDLLANFQDQPFSPRLDAILSPYIDVLFAIFSKPFEQNLHIPSVQYVLASKKKDQTIPYAGDLNVKEQAEIMNWFCNTIPYAKDHLTDWVGSPAHAHAITIVIAALNEKELRLHRDFPSQESEVAQTTAMWKWAWQLQQHRGRIPAVDVDRECLGLLEQWMFESSDDAGLAGDEQWGLDAGHHQDRWVPYKGLPAAWSSYRSGFEDNAKYEVSISN